MKTILTLALIFYAFFCQADGARGTYIWPEYTPIVVPDSLKKEPAFIVNNVTTLDFLDMFEMQIVVFKRIYINSEKAAETYSKHEMFLTGSGSIEMINARTLKADGTILNLTGNQIIETFSKEKNKYGTRTVRRFQLAYPQVQVGDVIDIAYQVNFPGYIYSDLMYLEDEIPSLYSRVTLRNMSRLELTAYSLNSMPKSIQRTEKGIPTISWEKSGVAAMKTDFFNALPPTAPSFVYALWKPGEIIDYDVFYESEIRNLPGNFNRSFSIHKYFEEEGVLSSGDDKLVQIKKIINFFEKECTWNNSKSTEYSKQSGDFLKRKEIDGVLFMRYMIKFLDEKGIKAERGFTKSLLDGKFEQGFVSLEQLSNRYLVIYDDLDRPHFLFPPSGEGKFYYLDEIPYYLEGNQSVTLIGGDALEKSGGYALPESSKGDNRHNGMVIARWDEADEIAIRRKDQLMGHYSYLTRSKHKTVWLEELNISKDSILPAPKEVKDFYPYEVTYEGEKVSKTLISAIEDSLFWMNPSEELPSGVYQSDELNETYGNYLVLPFLKELNFSVFIQSTAKISNAEDISTVTFSNSIGEISVNVFQKSENVLQYVYTVKVLKRYISGDEEVKQFKDLMQNYQDVRTKKWVIAKA